MTIAYQLNAIDNGKGPVVVLLHGYLASAVFWNSIAKSLIQSHRVIQLDLLGFGHSPKPQDADYSTKQHTDSVYKTLQALKINQPFTLVGHSMGTQIASWYTNDHPEQVQKLVLINPPLFKNRDETRRELVGTSLAYRATLYTPLHRIIWPALYFLGRAPGLNRLLYHNFRGRNSVSAHHTSLSRSRTLKNTVEATPIFDLINSITVPTTIMVGRFDRDIYHKNLHLIKKRPNIKIETFDTGHYIPQYQPSPTIAAISAR